MSDSASPVATPSQTVGPFFHVAFTGLPHGGMAVPVEGTDRIRLRVSIADGDGQPVEDALVEIWHAAALPGDVFGRLPMGTDGACEFETVRPPQRRDGARHAAHINVCLFARGLLRQLHTRIYFAGDTALADDPVLALVPADRRSTLLAHSDPQHPGRWLFHVRLQGAQETVFFDP